MNTPPDFSKYTKQLNIEQLKKQGTQALADELSYTRQLYESLDTIFQDSLDGFFITDGEGIYANQLFCFTDCYENRENRNH